MEVHHHPEVGNKTFKEYLLEGLMIFVAVTLGFFAESLREHINERSKEGDYIVSLAQDLRTDTARIDQALKIDTGELSTSDELMSLLLTPATDPRDIREAYNIVWITMDQEDVHFSNRTYDELKSSGDMRLIHSRKVTDSIEYYENGIRNCEDQDAYYGRQTEAMGEACGTIFLSRFRFLPPGEGPFHFATTEPAVFNVYCSRLGFYQGVLRSYIRMIREQKQGAVALLSLLQKEYDL